MVNEDEAADPARIQELGEIDVVHFLVMVGRAERVRAEAEGVVEDELLGLVVSGSKRPSGPLS